MIYRVLTLISNIPNIALCSTYSLKELCFKNIFGLRDTVNKVRYRVRESFQIHYATPCWAG